MWLQKTATPTCNYGKHKIIWIGLMKAVFYSEKNIKTYNKNWELLELKLLNSTVSPYQTIIEFSIVRVLRKISRILTQIYNIKKNAWSVQKIVFIMRLIVQVVPQNNMEVSLSLEKKEQWEQYYARQFSSCTLM